MFGVRTAAWLLLAGCALTAAVAETASGTFGIRVILRAPPSLTGLAAAQVIRSGSDRSAICTGESRAQGAATFIQVLCTVGPFVSITPMPGQARGVEAGEAFRYDVAPGSISAGVLAGSSAFDATNPVGTVTALQVSNATGHSSAIEMLVSF